MRPTLPHVKRVMAQTRARFIDVLPTGLRVGDGEPTLPSIEAELVRFGDARTLYRARRPICRSLDGIRSATDGRRECAGCLDSKHCVAQILVELDVDALPCRLLLAYTSAKNFLRYIAARSAKKVSDDVPVRITVKNRGYWGELIFATVNGDVARRRRPALRDGAQLPSPPAPPAAAGPTIRAGEGEVSRLDG